ncbi:MAG TPA: hypothetical protein VJP86_05485 [Vicinamibacterales bacterium]|nr:hypothetical protein [Vicinamibacterales bacterium]
MPVMRLFLVHHGEAVGPEVDPLRPLSVRGKQWVKQAATEAASRGAKPAVVWHSGKLRAKQTAEAFWRECNALAEFSATRDLQPDDPPGWMRDRLIGETRDVLIAGHFPHLPRLASLLLEGPSASTPSGALAPHGVLALTTEDSGSTWRELWRIVPPASVS